MERVTRLELATSTLGKKRGISYSRASIIPAGSLYSEFLQRVCDRFAPERNSFFARAARAYLS
jgi:hypothetical protein